MFQKIKEFLFGKLPVEQTPPVPVEAVPYKVESPVPVTDVIGVPVPQCGCGRSTTGFCVGLHKLSADEWAVHADNPEKIVPSVQPKKKPAAVKKPAAIKSAAKKPTVKKSVVKKPAARKKATN
jgi:hypothetical protein